MNELIEAAKAVIAATDTGDRWCAIANLSAAVERAENPPADFDVWWESTGSRYWPYEYLATHDAWTAAQHAERERCREIVITMGGPDVPELLRQIDSGEE